MDKKDVLARIDAALAEWRKLRARSRFPTCSDIPRDEVTEVLTLLKVTINRLAPRGSEYRLRADDYVSKHGLHDLRLLSALPGLLKALRRDYQEGLLSPEAVQATEGTADVPAKGFTRNVFVAHGRNTRLRDELFEFLRAVDLRPIEWAEAMVMPKKPSAHIGEILEAAFAQAGAVLVVLSPDDEARLKPEFLRKDDPEYEKELTGQARPNVLFEAGMAFATHQHRTILLGVGAVRPFSDVAGRYVIRFDGTPEKRRELINSLRSAGCPVNDSGSEWLKADFFKSFGDHALPQPANRPSDDFHGAAGGPADLRTDPCPLCDDGNLIHEGDEKRCNRCGTAWRFDEI